MNKDANVIIDKVGRDLYILRYNDTDTKYFEALWEIPEGVTYNAYLLIEDGTAILFDTWKKGLDSEFVNALNSIIDIRELKYIVIHHTEPDHSGIIKTLYEKNPQITILGSSMANKLIRSFYGINPRFKAVSDGEVLTIGDYKLTFIHIPWLHWPDTIATYISPINTLITCDVFGAYSIPKSVIIDDIPEDYIVSMRKYFTNIIGFYRDNVIKNLDKVLSITNNKIEVIAPSHGAVLRGNAVGRAIDVYREFALKIPRDSKIVIVYSSMYGFIDSIMNYITQVLNNWGFRISVYRFTDKERSNIGDLIGDVNNAFGIVLGISTYDTEPFPLMDYIIELLIRKLRGGKPILIITDYGWGDVVPKHVKTRLEKAGFTVIDTVSINGQPTEREFGRILGVLQNLKNFK